MKIIHYSLLHYSLNRVVGALEEVVAPAPIGVAGPIRVVVVAGLQEALGVGHEAHGATGGVHETGDAELGAVVVIGVLEGNAAGVEVFLGVAGFADETAFSVGGGKLEVFGQVGGVGAVGGHFHQLVPHAFEALALVPDEGGLGQDAQLGENLEAVADAEEEAAVGVVLLQGIAQETLGFQLGQAAAHHVVTIGEAAGENDELGLGHMGRGGGGDGLHLGGETGGVEGACGFDVAVGAGVFEK